MPRWWAALLVGLVASSSSSSPNTDSCYFNNDGVCDDGVYGACLCGTDYSDCGFRYERDCATGPPPPPHPSPPWQVDDTKSDDGKLVLIILLVAGVLLAIVAVAIVGCIVSLKCFAIFVLVLSIITLVITIASVFTFVGIPAAAISLVAFLLACIGSSIIVCGCCKDKDGNPCGHISSGVLCLLSFIFRLAAFVVLLITFLLALPFIFAIAQYALFVIIALALMTVLTVATGLAELVLGIRCIIWACAKQARGAAAGAAGAAGSMMGQSDAAPQQVELVVGTAASSPAAVAHVAVAVPVA